MIRDCLTRIAHIEYGDTIEIVPCPEPFGYRLRTQFHADVSEKKIGFFRSQSHEIEDIKECMVLTPSMNKVLKRLRNGLTQHIKTEGILDIEAAAIGETESIYAAEVIEPTNELKVTVGDEVYLFNAKTFFQGNELMLETLVNEVTSGMGREDGT